nr:MAG TPA: hypothetical protein [Caudoviricetes sp.]
MRLFRKREPTKNQGESKAENTVLKMVTTLGEFYYEIISEKRANKESGRIKS